jgi:hypothetical protein
MPLVRIDVRQGKDVAYRQEIGRVVYEALVGLGAANARRLGDCLPQRKAERPRTQTKTEQRAAAHKMLASGDLAVEVAKVFEVHPATICRRHQAGTSIFEGQNKQKWLIVKDLEAGTGIEPVNSGFADRGLTTWLPRRIFPEPIRWPLNIAGCLRCQEHTRVAHSPVQRKQGDK